MSLRPHFFEHNCQKVRIISSIHQTYYKFFLPLFLFQVSIKTNQRLFQQTRFLFCVSAVGIFSKILLRVGVCIVLSAEELFKAPKRSSSESQLHLDSDLLLFLFFVWFSFFCLCSSFSFHQLLGFIE